MTSQRVEFLPFTFDSQGVESYGIEVLFGTMLANRLKTVMSKIISETQSALVGGHQLVDDVLVLNEVVDEVKNKKQQSLDFKVDFEKAYNCIDWSF